MENASKALLIAGAVLIAILLISIGILIINSTHSISERAEITSKTMAIETFNSQFIGYEGKKESGAKVKALFSTVKASNASNEQQVTITYNDEPLESMDIIKPSQKYEVACAYSNGYISNIAIKGASVVKKPEETEPEEPTPTIPEEPTPAEQEPEKPTPAEPTPVIPAEPENRAPIIITNELNSKTINSFKLNVNGKDDDGDKLTYTLYISTTKDGEYQQKQTISAQQNIEVNLSATGLQSYTTYWWYITASDGEKEAQSDKQSLRTYCPGTGLTCTATYCSGTSATACSRCSGTGKVSKYCSGGSWIACRTCGGSGRIPCPGSPSMTSDSGYSLCSSCKTYCWITRYYRCNTCGTTGSGSGCDNCHAGGHTVNHNGATITCTSCRGSCGSSSTCSHGYSSSHNYSVSCGYCTNGYTYGSPCIHGYSSGHYYCQHSNNAGSSTHQYCSHGKTSQHD